MPSPTDLQTALQTVNDTLVKEFELDPSVLRPEARLREDLGLDSLDGVDLVVSLEKALSVVIPEETARQMRTVGDIYAHMEKVALTRAAEATPSIQPQTPQQ